MKKQSKDRASLILATAGLLIFSNVLWGQAPKAAKPEAKAVSGYLYSNPPVTPDPTYKKDDWSNRWPHISYSEALRLHQASLSQFIDARMTAKWKENHLPGAVSLSADEFEESYNLNGKMIDKDKILVVYCNGTGCHMSDKVASWLARKGFKNIAVFSGGWPEWQKNQLKEKSSKGKSNK